MRPPSIAWNLASSLGAGLLLAAGLWVVSPQTVVLYCDDPSWWCRLLFICDCLPDGAP